MDHDEQIAALRRSAERSAYEVAMKMLQNPNTPPTALASIVKTLIAAGAANTASSDDLEPHAMTPAQISAATSKLLAQLNRSEAADAKIIDITPVPRTGIFD